MVEEDFPSMDFLECSYPEIYKNLWSNLWEKPHTGVDNYLKTLTESFSLIINYRPLTPTNPQYGGRSQRGINVQFTQIKVTVQQHEATSGTYGNTRADVTCFNCQRPGNIFFFFPNRDNAAL